MEKIILSVGLNDQTTKRQEITMTAAKRYIERACLKYTDGATVYNANGIYKHANGQKVNEKTIRIELYNANIERVKALCADIKKALNQESIAVERQKIISEFM